MASVSSTVWNDIIGQVRLKEPTLIRGWFSDLEPIRLERGVLEIKTGNDAQSRYLEQHCRRAFAEAAQAATGRLVSVLFEAEAGDSAGEYSTDFPLDVSANQVQLNPDFTFEHFVTGPCNRLAHAAAVAVAGSPGRAYNPFFVHGPVGLGKTHLLQGICHEIRRLEAGARCCYLSCETFINHFIEAVERGLLHHFRYRYRHVDVLIIDDIQFLAERERSQEEFFHTFNTLAQSQRQIILSADGPPAEIPSLKERLVSRFNSGLVALLDPPCLETRMAIIGKKAKLRCIEVPEEVVRFVASRIDSNIRELEGALLKIDAFSHTRPGPLTLNLAREALGVATARSVPIQGILKVVAQRFRVKVSELRGKKRNKAITGPRHIGMYLARRLTSQSLEQIGGHFGGRDHTTVLHGSRVVEQQAGEDADFRQLLDEISFEVKNASYQD